MRAGRHGLVKALIYPVPDPAFPFLGVHFTRMIGGGVEAGPNAVLSLKREGYGKTDFDARDAWETLAYPGFWRMASRYWRTGAGEVYRSFSKRAFVRALQRLLPELRDEDLDPGGSGVRAQAVDRNGGLLDDFCIQTVGGVVHVLNAPSPAATASLPIGEHVAAQARAAWEN
jgi:L-2-hydroxyglutarate oxidase